MTAATTIDADIWSDWLLRHRSGGDREYERRLEQRVLHYVDCVLDHAAIKPAESVVDLGTGTGVLAWRAIERCGGDLQVTQTDISPNLLRLAQTMAERRGVSSICRFLECSAEDLRGIDDTSQDVVLSRASIAYVNDKAAAFREMHRVLRPGGRISLAEPIRQPDAFEARILREHLAEGAGTADRFLDLLHRWKSAQYPDSDAGRSAMAFTRIALFEGSESDEWSAWLLELRHGGDPGLEPIVRSEITREADRAIDGAAVQADTTLVDVGAGDGLAGLRAIERFGERVRVIFTDISAPMLRHVSARAIKRGVHAQCSFLQCSAERMEAIADGSVDAVVTRASLAYVPDKRAALAEFRRILRPGGRLSLVEPVVQDESFIAMALRRKLDATPVDLRDPMMVWRHRCMAAQYPDTLEALENNPLVNFSERDVLRFVQAAGFKEIHMQVHFDIEPSTVRSWDTFIQMSPHPWALPLKTVLEREFTPQERRQFEAVVRPQVEQGLTPMVGRALYLQASSAA